MTATLQAKIRPDLKNSTTREFRLNGHVPAVVFGKKIKSTPVAVDSIEFIKLIREVGRNGIISLSVEGEADHQVIVTDIQQDPIKGELIHLDFFEVDMTSEMDATVPVRLSGEAPGVGEGGMVSHLLHEITVRSLPNEIPEFIEVDISSLMIGDSIQIGDLKTSDKVKVVNASDETIVTVLHAPAEKEPGLNPEPDDDEGGHAPEEPAETDEKKEE